MGIAVQTDRVAAAVAFAKANPREPGKPNWLAKNSFSDLTSVDRAAVAKALLPFGHVIPINRAGWNALP